MIIVRCLSIIKIWHSSLFLLCWKQKLNSLTQQGLTVCTMLFISAWSVLTADLFVPAAKATGHKKDANVPHCVLRQIALTWPVSRVFKGYGWIQLQTFCYTAYHEKRQYQYVVNKISDLLASPLHLHHLWHVWRPGSRCFLDSTFLLTSGSVDRCQERI